MGEQGNHFDGLSQEKVNVTEAQLDVFHGLLQAQQTRTQR